MKKIDRKTIKIFFMIAIPITIIWVGLIVNNIVKEKEFLIEKTISEAYIQDKNTSVLIDSYMSEVIENLKVIRDADEFNLFNNNPSKVNNENVTQLFIRIMSNKEDYYQLRYIDTEGNEIIRLNNKNNIEVVATQELQNKKDRYYFTETMKLEFDEVFISPLDLNIEGNEVELPYQPMLRFATPVYNDENLITGILVVNYKADYFMNLISDHQKADDITTYDYHIINQLGQFILHENNQLNFSYMFKETSDLSYKDMDEDLWSEMVGQDFMGHTIKGNSIYTYYDTLAKVKENNTNYDQSWIIVHELDVSALMSVEAVIKRLLLPSNFLVLIIIMIASASIVYFIQKTKSQGDQLAITKKIAENSNDAVVITSDDTEIIYVNKAYEESTGYRSNEVIGLKPSHFKSGKHTKEFYKTMWKDIDKLGQWDGMLWDKKKDGLLYPKKLKIIAVNDKKDLKTHHYVGIFSDISAKKRKSDTYNVLNHKNSQSIIPNEDMIIELLSQNVEADSQSFMVVYVTIENYNQLINFVSNENYDISEMFTETIKPLLYERDFIAQTSRNLFMMIINIDTIKETPEERINLIHKRISSVNDINGRDIFFKTRIGVSMWPKDTKDIKELLLNALIALEWTSNRQEKTIAFYDKRMIEELNHENEIEGHLRKAIEKNEFSIVYQPQVEISTGKVVGMEALLRWENDVLGFVSPAVFIPIAEKNHLMIEIGNWVIEKVFEELSCTVASGLLKTNNLRCAINLSVVQMEEINFVDYILEAIDRHNIQCQQLEMEITESLLFTNEKKNVETLDKLRANKLTVAIDDFGTGYSSLSYLNTMPVDKIKIDRIFVKNYPHEDDGKLVKLLVNMSKSLGMKVLVEGAETKEQVDYLKSIGCDYIQGYYYSKPLSLNKFADYVEQESLVT